ncbi:CDP-alcohol phosphatidyltransferase family protein [Rhodobacteraceae bacterium XHP0102]|nr:CDP-alcohol phosphatidyltransferase family protein [Rhodobacteraceae bacterium XHP0102]
MIDARLLPLQRRLTLPVAQALYHRGVQADHITLTGFMIGMAALPALAMGQFTLALLLILLNRTFDGLDGAVARLSGPTDRGAFLDIALDFLFYASVPLGFALADPAQNALPAAVLLAGFMGTGASFLAYAVIAAKRGMQSTDYPQKGFYYLGGLTEGAETIAIFIAFCLFPAAFPLLAMIFAAACAITTLTRLIAAWGAFDPNSK